MNSDWSWETSSRGAHAGAYDVDECDDGYCVDCNVVKATGRHRSYAFL